MKMVSLLDTTGIIIRPKYSAHGSIVIPSTTEYKSINSSGLLLCHREVQSTLSLDKAKKCKFLEE